MNIKTALLGLSLLAPVSLYASDAAAFAACDGIEDAKKQAKCEKKEAKKLAKLRAKTTPMAPSALNAGLASIDGEDVNPFNMDDYYTPSYEAFKIDAVDQVLGGVARINGALTMATYIGQLDKDGKSDEAKALATALLPELMKMKDDIEGIKEGINKIKADAKGLAKDNPTAVPKIIAGAATAAGQIPGMLKDLPKAVSAIKPLAAGAAGAAVNAATEKVMDAAGEAAGAAGEAVENAAEAASGN